MPMSLYLVVWENDHGYEYENIVEATSADEAMQLWAKNWELSLDPDPDASDFEQVYAEEVRVYALQPTGASGVLDWEQLQVKGPKP